MMRQFNEADVLIVAKAIVNNAEETRDQGDYGPDVLHYCNYCEDYYYHGYLEWKDVEHSPNCPYLVAMDLLT